MPSSYVVPPPSVDDGEGTTEGRPHRGVARCCRSWPQQPASPHRARARTHATRAHTHTQTHTHTLSLSHTHHSHLPQLHTQDADGLWIPPRPPLMPQGADLEERARRDMVSGMMCAGVASAAVCLCVRVCVWGGGERGGVSDEHICVLPGLCMRLLVCV